MRLIIWMTLVGLVAISLLSCFGEENTINCTFDSMLDGTSECNIDEVCDIQTSSNDDPKVTITDAACAPNENKKDPGETCKKDADCLKGICLEGTCEKVCFDKGWKCGGSETCVFPGWISSKVKKYKAGYCAAVSSCMEPAGACSAETECRYLINDNGIPQAGATYQTGCTFLLGDLGETESCDYSDQCAPGLVCAGIPDLEGSEQICRPVCKASAECGGSATGDWCNTNLEGSASSYKFKIGDDDFGVCTSAPSDDDVDTGDADTDAE